jgi:anti-anti-sigma factor
MDVKIVGNHVILSFCDHGANAFDDLARMIPSASRGRYGRFLLDLQGINELDSARLGEIARAYTTVRRQGGRLALVNVTRRTKEALAVSKLLPLFESSDGDEQTNVGSFVKPRNPSDPNAISIAMPLPDPEREPE